jgi:hypothetical protein
LRIVNVDINAAQPSEHEAGIEGTESNIQQQLASIAVLPVVRQRLFRVAPHSNESVSVRHRALAERPDDVGRNRPAADLLRL